jgi:hypothetical protein
VLLSLQVLEAVVAIRGHGETAEDVAATVYQNTERLFFSA